MVDNEGNTALHFIAKEWDELGPRVLALMKKVDMNAVNLKGETPLHNGALAGRMDCIRTLVKNRVDLNICNK